MRRTGHGLAQLLLGRYQNARHWVFGYLLPLAGLYIPEYIVRGEADCGGGERQAGTLTEVGNNAADFAEAAFCSSHWNYPCM